MGRTGRSAPPYRAAVFVGRTFRSALLPSGPPFLMLEREIKLLFDNPVRARAAVVATGATPLRCRRLQEDNLFDTPDETLRRRGCALRVRSESGKSLLTFKGPAQASPMKLR